MPQLDAGESNPTPTNAVSASTATLSKPLSGHTAQRGMFTHEGNTRLASCSDTSEDQFVHWTMNGPTLVCKVLVTLSISATFNPRLRAYSTISARFNSIAKCRYPRVCSTARSRSNTTCLITRCKHNYQGIQQYTLLLKIL